MMKIKSHKIWMNVDNNMTSYSGKKIQLKSLAKRKVFGLVVQTPTTIHPVGYRWAFVQKRNEQNEIV